MPSGVCQVSVRAVDARTPPQLALIRASLPCLYLLVVSGFLGFGEYPSPLFTSQREGTHLAPFSTNDWVS